MSTTSGPDYPEYNDDIILHLDQGVVIRVPGCIVRDDYEDIMLREALIESDKLPDVIDFTKEAWEEKFECWDAQGNDILNPPDNPLTKKLKARKNFNVIK